ncbi:hypothetical protein KCP75_08805 [Salmonella enterica subsp. enterica]|nr:hypothetical protein KCP75_08805 [Salmonella enterica subsp. enterica]
MVIEFVNLGQGIFMEGYGNNITGNIATGHPFTSLGATVFLTAADAPPVNRFSVIPSARG